MKRSLLLLAGLCGLALGSARAMAASPPEPAAWVVDPAEPGDNLPAAGRSQFDRLFAAVRQGTVVYDLPFPFDALLKLERRVSHDGLVSIGGNYYSVPDRTRRVVEVPAIRRAQLD